MTSSTTDNLGLTVPGCLALADTAYNRGDHAGTIEHLSAACTLDPTNPELELALGNVLLGNCDFHRSVQHYEKAVALQPESDTAHACLALALQLQGNSPAAMTAALKAVALKPTNDVALKVLARISLDAGEYDRARIYCDCVLARDPNDADAVAMRAQCAAAVAAGRATPSPIWEGLCGDFASRTKAWEQLGSEHILQQFVVGLEPVRIVVRERPICEPTCPDGFGVPPSALRMGYCTNDTETYLKIGRDSYDSLQRILASQSITLGAGDTMLDWGCASGRVIRYFTPEALRGCTVWGGDVHAPSIDWARANLTPFRFFNCSSLPHLPFADGTFKFIYALSVLTHIVALRDLWLLEIARILRPDGCAVLTIHDENTWRAFQKENTPSWMPIELIGMPELPGECLDIQGSTWDQTYTFFRSEYIRRVWGQFFEVVDMVPRAESRQTAVVLRRR